MANDLLKGLMIILQWQNIVAVVFGAFIGTAVGAIPGLSSSVALAILLPIAYILPAETTIIFMVSIWVAATNGGSITAILLNTPGTGPASATALDGYPLSLEGRSGEALAAAVLASMVGGIIGSLAFMFVAPPLAMLSLQFGAAEYVGLAFFGITFLGVLGGDDVYRGLTSGIIGLFIGTIGLFDGVFRYTGGFIYLYDGLNLIWVIIGLFVIPQVLLLCTKSGVLVEKAKLTTYSILKVFMIIIKMKFLAIYFALIGVVVGIIPGAGATLAAWIAYSEAKSRLYKPSDERKFGEGRIEGVIAPEIANNATVGGGLIPTLTLGIPGTGTAAVLLGGLIIAGLKPGYDLFIESGPQVYAIILSSFFAVFAFTIICFMFIPYFVKITTVSVSILLAVIFVFGTFAAYSGMLNFFGAHICVVIGVIAYMLKNRGFSLPAILLGFILSPITEKNLDRLVLSANARGISLFRFIIARPIAIILILLAGGLIIWRAIMTYKEKNRSNFPIEEYNAD